MAKFLMSSKKSKEAVEKASRSGGFASLKIVKKVTNILILGPISEDRSVVFTTTIHEMFANNKFIGKAASPAFTSEKDTISDIGWKVRDKYMESSNKKKQDFWKKMMPNRNHYINVLDLDDIEAGPMVYKMSGAVAEEVMGELKELGTDLTTICDFDEGRIVKISSNMKAGLLRRYKVTIKESTANLIEDGILDEDKVGEIAETMYDLEKLQPAFDQEAFESMFTKLKKGAEAIGINLDDLVEEEDEEDVEETDEFDDEDVDETLMGDDDDEEDDFDDEEEEDDIDDEEEEDDDFDEEDFDDDDEEEDEPVPVKKKKKVVKKKPVKKPVKKVAPKAVAKKKRRKK